MAPKPAPNAHLYAGVGGLLCSVEIRLARPPPQWVLPQHTPPAYYSRFYSTRKGFNINLGLLLGGKYGALPGGKKCCAPIQPSHANASGIKHTGALCYCMAFEALWRTYAHPRHLATSRSSVQHAREPLVLDSVPPGRRPRTQTRRPFQSKYGPRDHVLCGSEPPNMRSLRGGVTPMADGRLTLAGVAPDSLMRIGQCTAMCTDFDKSQSQSSSFGSRAISALTMLLHTTSMRRNPVLTSQAVGEWSRATHVAGAWESFLLPSTMVGVPSSTSTKRCNNGSCRRMSGDVPQEAQLGSRVSSGPYRALTFSVSPDRCPPRRQGIASDASRATPTLCSTSLWRARS